MVLEKHRSKSPPKLLKTIFNLRNSRFALLTNADDEPLPDGKAFEVMRDELAKMEENYLALFIGKSSKQSYEFSLITFPEKKRPKAKSFSASVTIVAFYQKLIYPVGQL